LNVSGFLHNITNICLKKSLVIFINASPELRESLSLLFQ